MLGWRVGLNAVRAAFPGPSIHAGVAPIPLCRLHSPNQTPGRGFRRTCDTEEYCQWRIPASRQNAGDTPKASTPPSGSGCRPAGRCPTGVPVAAAVPSLLSRPPSVRRSWQPDSHLRPPAGNSHPWGWRVRVARDRGPRSRVRPQHCPWRFPASAKATLLPAPAARTRSMPVPFPTCFRQRACVRPLAARQMVSVLACSGYMRMMSNSSW